MLLTYSLPQRVLSRFFGRLAIVKQPYLKNWMIHTFIKKYGVNMAEAIEPEPTAYPDFNHFFIRKLKPELRPIAAGEQSIISPVDGMVSQVGRIQQGQIFQAKNHDYSVLQLLGGDTVLSETFAQGHFITLYLAPKDYHRVHMPFSAELKEMIYVPGKLFSVQPRTVEAIPGLFAMNERVVAIFDTAFGPMAMVLVGAVIVDSINMAWHGLVTPNASSQVQRWQYDAANLKSPHFHFAKGDEMGYFQLGSTVIVLFANPQLTWQQEIRAEATVKFGQLLGNYMV